MRNTLSLGALAVVVTAIIGLVVADSFGVMEDASGDRIAGLVAALTLAVLIGSGLFGRYRSGASGGPLVHIAIWLAVIGAAALLYVWKDTLLGS
jgi:hypothetical protein